MINSSEKSGSNPIQVEEVITLLRSRWGVSYDFKLLIKGKSLYLQMMWGFLEQQSFPLTEKEYLQNLAHIFDVVNRLGLASEVRNWLFLLKEKPRVGRAISLPLIADWRLKEFVI